tara:strand:- start:852 stop:1097 length:246 start_codon:yes stop_codon:yes gene_type:complete
LVLKIEEKNMNDNILNIVLLKSVLNELPKDGSYDDVMNKMEDIKETIREVIESLRNQNTVKDYNFEDEFDKFYRANIEGGL